MISSLFLNPSPPSPHHTDWTLFHVCFWARSSLAKDTEAAWVLEKMYMSPALPRPTLTLAFPAGKPERSKIREERVRWRSQQRKLL